MTSTWRNWAGNVRITAPATIPPDRDAVVSAVLAARERGGTLKATGSGHSFTPIAETGGDRLVLDRLAGVVAVDRDSRVITVGAGMTLRRLNEVLAGEGLALPNLGDVDQQTIAGAISTGTHGTGAAFGGLATFVTELELVTGTGEVVRCSADRRPHTFAAARVGLGALGVVTEVTLRCQEAFTLRADERPMRLDAVLADLDEHVGTNDHFEFYWFPYTDRTLTKRNNRLPAGEPARPLSRFRNWLDDEFLANSVFGLLCRLGRRAPRLVPAINAVAARALTPRTYADRSDRVFCSPRRVRFVEMEYAIPRPAVREALAGVRRVAERSELRIAFPVEVRFAATDDIWLSTGYQRDNAYVAVHQFVGMPYEPYFRAVEAVMTALDGRPHWGKLHSLDAADLAPRYPRFADFLDLRDALDPDRVFGNAHLERVLGS